MGVSLMWCLKNHKISNERSSSKIKEIIENTENEVSLETNNTCNWYSAITKQ